MYYLVEKRSDKKTPLTIPLHLNDMNLGYDSIQDLKNYSKISKIHARLTFRNDSWFIEDVGSKHGVFINFKKIGRNPIKIGKYSVIGLGGTVASDDVFICVLCSNKELCEDKIDKHARNEIHSKDKPSSTKRLCSDSDLDTPNLSDFKKRNKAEKIKMKSIETEFAGNDTEYYAQPTKKEHKIILKAKRLNKTLPQINESKCRNLINPSKGNCKVLSYLRSMEANSEQNDVLCLEDENFGANSQDDVRSSTSSLYIEDENVFENSQDDDDVRSTTSSIKSMNIIRYPSASVIEEIEEKKREQMKRCTDVNQIDSKNKSSEPYLQKKHIGSSEKSRNNSVKEYENPRLSNKHLSSNTVSSESSAETVSVSNNSDKFPNSTKSAKQPAVKKRSDVKNSAKGYEIPRLSNKHLSNSIVSSKRSAGVNVLVSNNSEKCPNRTKSTKQPSVKKKSDVKDSGKGYKIPHLSSRHLSNNKVLSESSAEANVSVSNNSVKYPNSTKCTNKPSVTKKSDVKDSGKGYKIPHLSSRHLSHNKVSSESSAEANVSVSKNSVKYPNSTKCTKKPSVKKKSDVKDSGKGYKIPHLSNNKVSSESSAEANASISNNSDKCRNSTKSTKYPSVKKRSDVKDSLKGYEIPCQSNKHVSNNTVFFESSAKANVLVSNSSDKYLNSTKYSKQPAVKKRSDDSHMKHLLEDRMTSSTKKDAKSDQTKRKNSFQSREGKQRELPSSVISQLPCEETTSVINNSPRQSSLNIQKEITFPIPKSLDIGKNIEPNVKTTDLNINKSEKNANLDLSVLHKEMDFEIIELDGSPSFPDSENFENEASIFKDNSNTHIQSSGDKITPLNSSSLVSNECSESLEELKESKSGPSEPNSYGCSEFMLKHCSSTKVPISMKSSAKCTGKSSAKSDNTSYKNFVWKIIKKIVEMSPKWLKEKGKSMVPPSSIRKDVAKLPLSFDSYDVYVNLFLQMILLEVWETVCCMSEPYLKSKDEKKFYFSVLSHQYVNGLMKLHCESIVNKDVSYSPYNNNLVILDLKFEDKTWHSTFGLITNHEIESLQIESMSTSQWKFLPTEWLRNAQTWKFDVYVKGREITVTKQYLMEGNGICNLEDQINRTEALSHLKFSSMVDCILTPDWKTFSVNYSNQSNNDYHEIQKNICNAVYSEMTLSTEERKIVLLEGPPGSGKTGVIARICQKITENCPKNFKVLVTAPSHFAVDNIANQLIEFNEQFDSHEFTFLRTGDPHFIDPKYFIYSVHKKLEKARNKFDQSYSKWKQNKQTIQNKIFCYQQKSFEGKKSYKREIAHLEAEEQELKEKKWDEMNETYLILSDASIILSTFSDCLELYKAKINFSCCIIDEANQATELDSLFPFMIENSKFFIVGDTKQLPPTIKSELALKYGFQRSMLERFQMYFIEKYKKSPAIQLRMQFRMHGEISKFPMKTFYFPDYIPPSYSYAFIKCDFKPYIVLDDISDQYPQTDSVYDKTGSAVITSLCSCIVHKCALGSKAIIVPSVTEKNIYKSALMAININLAISNIEVDTVDSFQGRQKSICILSCYHDFISNESLYKFFSCEKRMNASLTRATNCLIICGPMHLLDKLPHWNALIKDSKERNCYIPYSHGGNVFDIFTDKILIS